VRSAIVGTSKTVLKHFRESNAQHPARIPGPALAVTNPECAPWTSHDVAVLQT